MSLSAQDRRSVWEDHADYLSRIKTQLGDRRSPTKVLTPTRSPVGGRGRRSHSPYGKYRQSTPPYLPRLETPPDQRRKASKVRGNRYEVVPPVRDSKGQDSRNTDYDSWGEESDDEPDVDPGHYMPYPHAYAAPPQVVFGAPFPVYYPQPPPVKSQKRRRIKTENDYSQPQYSPRVDPTRQPLVERYQDVNRSVPSKSKRKQSQRVHFSHPMAPMNGYMGYPGFPTYVYPQYYGGAGYYGREEGKYKYIHPRDTPFSPSELHGDNIYNRLKDEPPSTVDSLFQRVRDDIVSDGLTDIMHDVVRTTLNELVDEYMLNTQSNSDPLESFLSRLLNDAVQEAAVDVTKETVREMARDYVDVKHYENVFDDLLDEYLDEIGDGLVEDAVLDWIAEDFIRDEVIERELQEEVPEIAKSVLSHYDTKVMRRELKEVSSHAGDKLMESIIVDYLLNLVARQGNVWTESDHANKYMDDMISSVLLEKQSTVAVQRRKTVKNKPLKKIHEKLVTDAALDVCLQQLTASLDEDLLDVDEYERGVNDQMSSHNTPVS